jgi:3-oxoacyl-(acyl-carrier-protein) synthase
MFAGSSNATGFWRDIVAGRDLLSDVPPSHWSLDDYYDPDPKAPDRTYGRRGSFLDEVEFDPMEFGIPPKILSATDTSQLLALIVARQLVDDAANTFDSVDPQKIGVVLGASTTELCLHMSGRLQAPVWERAMREAGLDPETVDAISGRVSEMYVPWDESTFPGLLGNVVSGRVANRFDFGGPNCVVDAACASSLAALQNAVGELRLGRADLMISGGVDALNDILMFTCFSQTGALSATGDCRPFSAQADGTMLAEGLSMFALKRLDDAERDDDSIYAVIRGIGSSSDGRAKSIFAPRREGQSLALQRAYEDADYSPRTVGMLEAHGTGTRAGDVAETSAACDVFAADTDDRQWCALGSVKSQIGHAKAAAGAAGLFKAVMSLHHAVLPPTIKITEPNPKLNLQESPFYLNTEPRPWIHGDDTPRRASVSAFGFGGTNYHVALEEYRGPGRPRRRRTFDTELVLLEAPTPAALVERCRDLAAREHPSGTLTALAWETQSNWDPSAGARTAIVAADEDDLSRKLLQTADAIERRPALEFDSFDAHYCSGGAAPRVALRFGGAEHAYPGMGAELAMSFEAAREVWDRVAASSEFAALPELVHGPPALDEATKRARKESLAVSDLAEAAAACATFAAARLLRPALEAETFGTVPAAESLEEFVATLAERPDETPLPTLSDDVIVVDLGPSDEWARSLAASHPKTRVLSIDSAGSGALRQLWNVLGSLAAAGVPIDFAPFWKDYLPVDDPRNRRQPRFAVKLTGATYGKPQPAKELEPAPAPAEPTHSDERPRPQAAAATPPRPQQPAPLAAQAVSGPASDYIRFQQQAARTHIDHLETLAGQFSPSAPAAQVLDPRVDRWLNDHCPTFTRPALPMMSIVDAMAGAAVAQLGGVVTEVRDVEVTRWIPIDGPTRVETYTEPAGDGWLKVWFSVGAITAPSTECVATGRVRCAPMWDASPSPLPALTGGTPLEDPYRNGRLFHGPAFQVLQQAISTPGGASGLLTAHPGSVPVGILNPALLDGSIHVIPYDELERWSDEIPPDCLAYPNRVDWLTLHDPTPLDGSVTVEVRLSNVRDHRFPTFRMQFWTSDRLWADMSLTEILVPKGRLGRGEPAARRAFLRDRQFVPGLGLSRFEGDQTRLAVPEIRKNNWFQGTVEAIYDVHGDLREQTRQAVIKDHLASRLRCHPSRIVVEEGSSIAFLRDDPNRRFAIHVEMDGPMTFVARDAR